MPSGLSRKEIERLFSLLNEALRQENVVGELYLVGGAVMCLVFGARESTKDIDAFFQPATKIREAATLVAEQAGVSPQWLNDAVKGFLSSRGQYDNFLDLSNLRIFSAQPDYLLAMKCLSMRIGKEFHDESDIRYLLRYLNIETYEQAIDVIGRFYPLKQFPQKTLYALEEILSV